MTNMTFAKAVAEVIEGAVAKEFEKANGVVLTGIEVRSEDSNVATVIYIDKMIEEGLTVDEVAEKVSELAKEKAKPSIDTSVFTDKDFVTEHLRARLYNKATNAEVFRSAEKYGFADLIIVPYIENVIENGSVRINNSLLDGLGMTADEVLDIAEENSRQAVKVQTMAEIMAEMMGMELPMDDDAPQMHVVTNDTKTFGAYAIIPMLNYFKDKFPEGFAVLPSSVHEVIVVETNDPTLDNMVQEVNDTQVQVEEQLSNHAYRFVA